MGRWNSLLLFNAICLAAAYLHREEQSLVEESHSNQLGDVSRGLFSQMPNDTNDVKYYLYTRSNKNDGQLLYVNNITSVNQSYFDASKKTKFVTHGFVGDVHIKYMQTTKNAFLENYDYNVILIDWSELAFKIFTRVWTDASPVGYCIAQFIDFLVKNASVSPSDVHLIGHSLGAQVVGFTGKEIQKLGYNVSRITGLDPVLPGYWFANSSQRIASSDADYVDCIHTSAFFFGIPSAICQADFFPNGGTVPQPGCGIIDLLMYGLCSHLQAYRYFRASINESIVFHAETCKSVTLGIAVDCSDEGAVMGYPAGTEKYQGIFYLKTSGKSPYAESS